MCSIRTICAQGAGVSVLRALAGLRDPRKDRRLFQPRVYSANGDRSGCLEAAGRRIHLDIRRSAMRRGANTLLIEEVPLTEKSGFFPGANGEMILRIHSGLSPSRAEAFAKRIVAMIMATEDSDPLETPLW